jgi:hypothetical protein
MNVSRETVALAFYGLFNPSGLNVNGGLFTTVTRTWDLPQQLSPEQLPAIYCIEDDEVDTEAERTGVWNQQVYVLKWRLAVVAQMPGKDSGVTPMSVINPMIDAVDGIGGVGGIRAGTLPGTNQTLGGIVSNVFIDGQVMKVPGYLGQYALGVIPISIYTGI